LCGLTRLHRGHALGQPFCNGEKKRERIKVLCGLGKWTDGTIPLITSNIYACKYRVTGTDLAILASRAALIGAPVIPLRGAVASAQSTSSTSRIDRFFIRISSFLSSVFDRTLQMSMSYTSNQRWLEIAGWTCRSPLARFIVHLLVEQASLGWVSSSMFALRKEVLTS
jgi:hypothetical protein